VPASPAFAVTSVKCLQRLEIGAIGEEDVEPAVVVVIENGDSAGHRFGCMPLRRFIAIELEVDRLKREPDRAFAGGRSGILRGL
jgi:hypothetical protein